MARLGVVQLDDELLLKGIQTDAEGNEYADFEGLAATDDPDLQRDVTLQGGVDWPYFRDHGCFTWEHSNAPEDWVGVPLEVRPDAVFRGKKGTYVKGRLFLKQKRARAIYDTMQAIKAAKTNRRMGLSIQGKVLVRDPLNRRIILRSLVNKISFTTNPVNTVTEVTLLKGLDGTPGLSRDAWRELVDDYLGDLLGEQSEAFADTLFSKALTAP